MTDAVTFDQSKLIFSKHLLTGVIEESLLSIDDETTDRIRARMSEIRGQLELVITGIAIVTMLAKSIESESTFQHMATHAINIPNDLDPDVITMIRSLVSDLENDDDGFKPFVQKKSYESRLKFIESLVFG